MKFEQLLRLYWSRGFLYGGKISTYNVTLSEFFEEKPGLGRKARRMFVQRFELTHLLGKDKEALSALPLDQRKIINMYLSQLISVNYNIFDTIKYGLVRLYLIKTFRGRCHAIGKPSRGQRTWSNASTAYRCDRVIRLFIRQIKKSNAVERKTPLKAKAKSKGRGAKIAKVKSRRQVTRIKMVSSKKKKNLWF